VTIDNDKQCPIDGKQYRIDMNMDITGLHSLPNDQGAVAIFHIMVMQIMMAWGKQEGGGNLKYQRLFYRIRTKLEAATKTQDTRLILEQDEFDFLELCRTDSKLDFQANEAIMRVNAMIDAAVTK
jgi:hypothetical protein